MKRFFYFILSSTIMLVCMAFSASALDSAGRVVTNGGRLNLREKPSLSATVIGSIPNGSWLTLKGKSGSWYLAEYAKGKEAYVSEAYVENYTSSREHTVTLTSGRLNVRSGAGMSYAVIDSLYNGNKVLVIKNEGDWCRILYNGNKTGYASKAYLKKVTVYSAVKLNVPSFKQTDTRWKDYPIGTQGGTIGTIGCTTTALAMTESFHKNATITPLQMAKTLSYSSSGSLYWPTSYNVVNVTDGYLKEIYKLLNEGKPVVFGMKTAKGNQHWVTVYGYKGGDSLSASDFLVNDPGSSVRSNLQQVLDSYPYAYRLVYKK